MADYSTYRKEDKRQHITAWVLGFLVSASMLFTALEWSSDAPPLFDLSEMDDEDVEVDLDMMPKLKEEELLATPVKEKVEEKKQIENINKVEEVTDPIEELQKKISYVPVETDVIQDLLEKEAEDVPPIVQDFNDNALPERVYEELPEFPGGYSELVQWLTNVIHYPSAQQQARQEGTVTVEFTVEKDGSITGVRIIKRSPVAAFNDEALRVANMMPKWKPATQKGKPSRSRIQIPIVFAI